MRVSLMSAVAALAAMLGGGAALAASSDVTLPTRAFGHGDRGAGHSCGTRRGGCGSRGRSAEADGRGQGRG